MLSNMEYLQRFAAAWNSSTTYEEIANKTGLSLGSIPSYATSCRKARIKLKKLPRRHKGWTSKKGQRMYQPGDTRKCPLCEQLTPIEVFYNFPEYTHKSAYCTSCSNTIVRHRNWTKLLIEDRKADFLARRQHMVDMLADIDEVFRRYERGEDTVYFLPKPGENK